MSNQPITAKVRIEGVFYRGMDKPLLFSVTIEGHPEIDYAEVPEKDALFRQLAIDTGKPLKQWCLDWNDRQIELDRQRTEELVKRGLAFSVTSNEVNSNFYQAMKRAGDDFLKSIGADMEPD